MSITGLLGGRWPDIWGPAFPDEVKWSSKVRGGKAYTCESDSWVEQVGHRPCLSSLLLQLSLWGPAALTVFPFPALSPEHSRYAQDMG